MTDLHTAAGAEANRRWPVYPDSRVDVLTFKDDGRREGFVAGAEWAEESGAFRFALTARIHHAMHAVELTADALAEATELSIETVTGILADRRRISSLELALIAEAVKVPVETLLGLVIDVHGYELGYDEGRRDAGREVYA